MKIKKIKNKNFLYIGAIPIIILLITLYINPSIIKLIVNCMIIYCLIAAIIVSYYGFVRKNLDSKLVYFFGGTSVWGGVSITQRAIRRSSYITVIGWLVFALTLLIMTLYF